MSDTHPINIIERLPRELQDWVFHYLNFQDAILLSQVNKYFHQEIKPTTWPQKETFNFLQKAQRWNKHNQSFTNRSSIFQKIETVTNGFACFTCKRVLPRDKFSRSKTERQYAKSTEGYAWCLRYCLDCGVRDQKYRVGTVLERITGELTRITGGQLSIHHDSDSLLLCRICKTLSEFTVIRPAGRCRYCIISAPLTGRAVPEGTRSDLPQRGKMTVRCNGCNAVQEARDPVTGHIDCEFCFNEPRKFYKALKLHEQSVKKQERRDRRAGIGPPLDEEEEERVLLSLRNLFQSGLT